MEQSSKFLFDVGVILLAANLGGIIAVKFKQPCVLGQILAGLLIGPSVFGIIGETEIISCLSEIGVILLMFMAGLETDLEELKRSAGSSLFIALGGIVVPYILGVGAVLLFYKDATIEAAIFAGVILTATSISITVQSLREFNKVKDKVGVNILGAAIMDDVIGIVILAVVVGIVSPTNGSNPLIIIAKIIVFFVLALIVGIILVKLFSKYLHKFAHIVTPGTVALICCFLIAFFASELGLATIIGAYTAGIIFSKIRKFKSKVDNDFSVIAYTIFTPIFFANIGIGVDLNGITSIVFPVIFLVVAIFGKIIGCGVTAKLTGFSNKEALQVGIGMIPRAEVALIVANLGKNLGIIPNGLFTSAIVVSMGTTILTPILLKKVFKEKNNKDNLIKGEL
ncbi:cation:proton antiporter [Sedimentibacter sp. zth1]|uniref:cation:proton antiporter n=1 Tax=Sedimentibacter sp. zth1 TaxID=2816908 RepID=UPI001A93A488|nr:cation:proton antiporter [Sedimentibacter sp. zth1]QSX05054.1 cation:proton antiporter [Sedimentibacter sp. zth1]